MSLTQKNTLPLLPSTTYMRVVLKKRTLKKLCKIIRPSTWRILELRFLNKGKARERMQYLVDTRDKLLEARVFIIELVVSAVGKHIIC